MQFQVDAGDARPTFFELVAADRLVPFSARRWCTPWASWYSVDRRSRAC